VVPVSIGNDLQMPARGDAIRGGPLKAPVEKIEDYRASVGTMLIDVGGKGAWWFKIILRSRREKKYEF